MCIRDSLKGVDAEKYVKESAKTIAGILKVQEKEILFTSGGTESDNLALIGGAMANKRNGNHIIITSVEHAAVSQPALYLQEQGFEITYLPVDEQGRVKMDALEAVLRPDTIMVSTMLVNNEVEMCIRDSAYGLDNEKEQKIMVYDLGGGTFDVSVIEIGDGVIEVLSTAGNNRLGGDDFDQKVTDWMIEEFKKAEGVDLSADKMALQRLKEAAEKAKKELSSATTTNINLPFITATAVSYTHLDVYKRQVYYQ